MLLMTKIWNVLCNRSYMRYEANRIQSKDYKLGMYKINKISLSSYTEKNMYLRIDIVSYCISINLLINHIKLPLLNICNLG